MLKSLTTKETDAFSPKRQIFYTYFEQLNFTSQRYNFPEFKSKIQKKDSQCNALGFHGKTQDSKMQIVCIGLWLFNFLVYAHETKNCHKA